MATPATIATLDQCIVQDLVTDKGRLFEICLLAGNHDTTMRQVLSHTLVQGLCQPKFKAVQLGFMQSVKRCLTSKVLQPTAQQTVIKKMEETQQLTPDMEELKKISDTMRQASLDMKQSVSTTPPGMMELNKAQEELKQLQVEITQLKTRNAQLETRGNMLEEQKERLDNDIDRIRGDLQQQIEKQQRNNQVVKEEEMTPEMVERVNMNNNQMEISNMALGSSIEDILRRLNISVGNNAELRRDVEQLSNSIAELEVIEVEDLIETIHAIDDKEVKDQITDEICQGKKIVRRRQTRRSRKIKRGRPKGSKNSYKRQRKTKHQISMNQRRRNKKGSQKKGRK